MQVVISPWPEFDVLRTLLNEDYEAARDRLLCCAPAADLRLLLQPRLTAPDWQDRLQAYLLLAWLERREAFQSFLARLDAEAPHVPVLQRTVSGLDRLVNKYREIALEELTVHGLALAWEVVWKRFEHWPDWKRRPFAAILARLPKDRFSVEMGVLLLHELPQARAPLEMMLSTVETDARQLRPYHDPQTSSLTPEQQVSPEPVKVAYRAAVSQAMEQSRSRGITPGENKEPTAEQAWLRILVRLQSQIDERAQERKTHR